MSNIDVNKTIDNYQLGQDHVIEAIWLKYKSTLEGTWIMKIKEVLTLIRILKQYKPNHILELGTGIGCSTELMAFTLPEASIYTVEQNQRCIDIAKTMIPDSMHERIYFKHAKVGILKPLFEISPWQYWLSYTAFDWRNPDFILIDGPGPMLGKATDDEGQAWSGLAELPGGDIFNMLPLMKEGTIIYIDKRKYMVLLIKRFLSQYLEIMEEDKTGHIIFKRNKKQIPKDSVEFKYRDKSFHTLMHYNYFDK